MRAAIEYLPFVHPKLSVSANVGSFAAQMEELIVLEIFGPTVDFGSIDDSPWSYFSCRVPRGPRNHNLLSKSWVGNDEDE